LDSANEHPDIVDYMKLGNYQYTQANVVTGEFHYDNIHLVTLHRILIN